MKVAVLGCGPAGLLAAHAATLRGADRVQIFSRKEPSTIGGAQFLHVPIKGVTDLQREGQVNFRHMGDPVVYAEKVYGSQTAPTSWNAYSEGYHNVWNMQAAYEKLWGLYADQIENIDITFRLPYELRDRGYDYIFSCVPAPVVCPHIKQCEFHSQPVWIRMVGKRDIEPMTIIYSGDDRQPWYRASNIFDHSSYEYAQAPSIDAVAKSCLKIRKPLYTTCEGPSIENFYRLGRYGQWKKGVLIHHAFEAVMNAL